MTAQDFVVFAIVLAAAAYLGRTVVLSVSGRKSCGGCGSGKSCGSAAVKSAAKSQGTQSGHLIQIDLNGGFASGANGHAGKKEGRTPNRTTSG